MLGEITMVQLYSVALTAGKAHRDHKHHHAHQFDHNGTPITTPPTPTPQPRPTLPTHPLLTNGQINPNLRLNFAGRQPPQATPLVPGPTFNTQFPSRIPATPGRGPQQFNSQVVPGRFPGGGIQGIPQQSLQLSNTPIINGGLLHPSLVNPANVQFIDNTRIELDTHQLFKRNNDKQTSSAGEFGKKTSPKNKRDAKAIDPVEEPAGKVENKHKKRELLLAGGHLFDESLLSGGAFDKSLLDGLAGIGQNEPILQKQKQSDEREPAEAEVKAVMNVCSGCDEEPFGKALVFGWRTVPKKLYSGAFYSPARPECKAF